MPAAAGTGTAPAAPAGRSRRTRRHAPWSCRTGRGT
uniref:Uncharacterized protein n=1 Tax=Arundo donax TaxID=35708 RepID=A0A0A9F3H1_ARUDO